MRYQEYAYAWFNLVNTDLQLYDSVCFDANDYAYSSLSCRMKEVQSLLATIPSAC